MSMFFKSALTMLITAGFAGGAVYYGTNVQQMPSNEIELRAPEKLEKIEKAVVSVETKDHPHKQTKPSEREAKSSVIPGSQPVEELEPEPFSEPFSEPITPEPIIVERTDLPNIEPVSEPVPEPIAEELSPNINLARVMPMLMVQAEKIKTPEIKDQAFLDIVNFSVSQGQFKFADAAMLKIKQAELRDTARSQIAIGLAMAGRADDAFEVIDAVEIDTLRDVMRLQVIEAMIVPEKLPPGLRR